MSTYQHYMTGIVATFAFALFYAPATSDDVGDGQQRAVGELEPGRSADYTFECRMGEACSVRASFRPKHQKNRSEAECSRFQLKFFVDGEWFSTMSALYQYVEDASGQEMLVCVAYGGYGRRHPTAARSRMVTARMTNENIWRGLYVVDTTATPTSSLAW